MIKSKEIAGPSCLTKAHDDEPLFVLRANDALAPQLVREWASRYRASKGGQMMMTERQASKYNDALHLALNMEDWKAAQAKPHAEVGHGG